MGLDMYFKIAEKIDGWQEKDYIEIEHLLNEIHASNLNYDTSKVQMQQLSKKPNIDQVKIKVKMYGSDGCFVIFEEVGYLRKANQIHNWIVKNIQNGVDKCQSSFLRKDQLIQLKQTCNAVLQNFMEAESMLPTKKGFFFGSTGYDYCYLQDVKECYDMCEQIIKNTDFDKHVIIYYASW